jgi:Kef-type K+ transport system membrane component KefB
VQLILLIVVFGLMHAARSFAPRPELGSAPAAITLAAGFLLISALFTGNLFKNIGLPRLSGYLATGILVGPQVLALVTEQVLLELRIFNGVAIALIALTAGVEMDFRTMRPLLRGIAWISGVGILGTMLLLSGTAYLLSDLLPFTAGLSNVQKLALAFVLGVTTSAQSPAVVVALRRETEADGPLTRTVLGVVVASDLLVILLFALASTIARPLLGGDAGTVSPLASVAWEVFGSGIAGLLIGVLIAVYLRAVQTSGALFVVTAGFLVAEVGQRIHLDPLLIALTAGILVRNGTRYGDLLHAEIESASLPVYISFFAVAGATIHLNALADVGIPAAIFVLVRGGGFILGARAGASLAGSAPAVRKYAGLGLLPQAGLALALALLFARTYPQFGHAASALVFGIVGINEMIAPILYRWALVKSGEAGKLLVPADESLPLPGEITAAHPS